MLSADRLFVYEQRDSCVRKRCSVILTAQSRSTEALLCSEGFISFLRSMDV